MTALPSRDYRDPLEALLAKEEESCTGCRWRKSNREQTIHLCGHRRAIHVEADKRCRLYEERK